MPFLLPNQRRQSTLLPNVTKYVLCMLPVAVARFSSDGTAICYAIPVLWMTSHFLTLWALRRYVDNVAATLLQRRSNVVNGLTPMLRGNWLFRILDDGGRKD